MGVPHLDTDPPKVCGLTTPRAISLLLILFPVFLRVCLVDDPFPIWDTNPFKFPAPSIGVPPTLGLTLDVAMILGSALALVVSGTRVRLIEPLLFLLGAIVAALHGLFVDGGSLDNLRVGSGWTAALAAGIGVRHLASDPIVRRWLFAMVLGVSMPLAVQSLVQVFVDHPATVASYRANPQAFLEAKGWTPGSVMARNYERRLMQPEASGWFGMANVHATFAAAFLVGWCGVVVMPLVQRIWRSRAKSRMPIDTATDQRAAICGEPLLLGAFVLLCAIMLFLTRSKGGLAACVLGLAILGVSMLLARPGSSRVGSQGSVLARVVRLTPLAGPCVMLGMILLVTVRGLIGTSIGELSLLFRWFYISAATRIFASEPLLGVGPADFRPAYELAKNPLSPEEVTSPHSLPFDWLSTLGIGGIAWLAIVIGWSLWLGRSLVSSDPAAKEAAVVESSAGPSRAHTIQIGWAFLIIAFASATAFIIELGGYSDVLPLGTRTSDMALVILQSRLPGLILWLLATALLLARALDGELIRRALGCIGLTLLASACIDVAPVWANSAGLFFVMLGAASSNGATPFACMSRHQRATISAIVLLTTTPALWSVPRVMEWERALLDAGSDARVLGLLRVRAAALEAGTPLLGDSIERWNGDLPEHLKTVFDDSFDGLLDSQFLARAYVGQEVFEATNTGLNHPATLLSASDWAIEQALTRHRYFVPSLPKALIPGTPVYDEAAVDSAMSAVQWAAVAAGLSPPSSASYGALARAHMVLSTVRGPTSSAGVDSIAAAIAAFERAASLDPHGITYPLQLFELGRQTGDRALTRDWAEELLRRNENLRLDPLRALTPEQVSRVQAALRPSP